MATPKGLRKIRTTFGDELYIDGFNPKTLQMEGYGKLPSTNNDSENDWTRFKLPTGEIVEVITQTPFISIKEKHNGKGAVAHDILSEMMFIANRDGREARLPGGDYVFENTAFLTDGWDAKNFASLVGDSKRAVNIRLKMNDDTPALLWRQALSGDFGWRQGEIKNLNIVPYDDNYKHTGAGLYLTGAVNVNVKRVFVRELAAGFQFVNERPEVWTEINKIIDCEANYCDIGFHFKQKQVSGTNTSFNGNRIENCKINSGKGDGRQQTAIKIDANSHCYNLHLDFYAWVGGNGQYEDRTGYVIDNATDGAYGVTGEMRLEGGSLHFHSSFVGSRFEFLGKITSIREAQGESGIITADGDDKNWIDRQGIFRGALRQKPGQLRRDYGIVHHSEKMGNILLLDPNSPDQTKYKHAQVKPDFMKGQKDDEEYWVFTGGFQPEGKTGILLGYMNTSDHQNYEGIEWTALISLMSGQIRNLYHDLEIEYWNGSFKFRNRKTGKAQIETDEYGAIQHTLSFNYSSGNAHFDMLWAMRYLRRSTSYNLDTTTSNPVGGCPPDNCTQYAGVIVGGYNGYITAKGAGSEIQWAMNFTGGRGEWYRLAEPGLFPRLSAVEGKLDALLSTADDGDSAINRLVEVYNFLQGNSEGENLRAMLQKKMTGDLKILDGDMFMAHTYGNIGQAGGGKLFFESDQTTRPLNCPPDNLRAYNVDVSGNASRGVMIAQGVGSNDIWRSVGFDGWRSWTNLNYDGRLLKKANADTHTDITMDQAIVNGNFVGVVNTSNDTDVAEAPVGVSAKSVHLWQTGSALDGTQLIKPRGSRVLYLRNWESGSVVKNSSTDAKGWSVVVSGGTGISSPLPTDITFANLRANQQAGTLPFPNNFRVTDRYNMQLTSKSSTEFYPPVVFPAGLSIDSSLATDISALLGSGWKIVYNNSIEFANSTSSIIGRTSSGTRKRLQFNDDGTVTGVNA